MNSAGNFLMALVILFLAFAGFVIYFIFKQIQFVLTATNLYKKMVRRQDATIKLLMDIRDNTKEYSINAMGKVDDTLPDEEDLKCPNCSARLSEFDQQDHICSHCGKSF